MDPIIKNHINDVNPELKDSSLSTSTDREIYRKQLRTLYDQGWNLEEAKAALGEKPGVEEAANDIIDEQAKRIGRILYSYIDQQVKPIMQTLKPGEHMNGKICYPDGTEIAGVKVRVGADGWTLKRSQQ